jgi:hypothetical protein
MWYAQMVCYHVHVPLLLRLSNDVEENPGPRNINEIVDRTYTVHADFHQGDQLMFRYPMLENNVLPCHYVLLFIIKLNQLTFGTHPL